MTEEEFNFTNNLLAAIADESGLEFEPGIWNTIGIDEPIVAPHVCAVPQVLPHFSIKITREEALSMRTPHLIDHFYHCAPNIVAGQLGILLSPTRFDLADPTNFCPGNPEFTKRLRKTILIAVEKMEMINKAAR